MSSEGATGSTSSRKRSRVDDDDDDDNTTQKLYDVDVFDDDDFDLKVTVGSSNDNTKEEENDQENNNNNDDDDDGGGDNNNKKKEEEEGQQQQKKEYMYHSKVLSFYSGYIRRMLLSPMKESTTMELTFPDITPKTWELMIELMTNPISVRTMTAFDALDVLPFYDKYDFTKGIELCDDILAEYIRQHLIDRSKNEDVLVDAASLGHILNLKNTSIQGKIWINGVVSGQRQFPMLWTVDHVKKLVPIIASNNIIQASMRDRIGMIKEELDREFIESAAFPNFIVSQYQLIAAKKTTRQIIHEIEVSGCDLGSGLYLKDDECSIIEFYTYCPTRREFWEGNLPVRSFKIMKIRGEEWKLVVIVPHPNCASCNIPKDLYTCKDSRYSIVPPKSGWETKSGWTPKLRYFHKNVDDGSKVEITSNL